MRWPAVFHYRKASQSFTLILSPCVALDVNIHPPIKVIGRSSTLRTERCSRLPAPTTWPPFGLAPYPPPARISLTSRCPHEIRIRRSFLARNRSSNSLLSILLRHLLRNPSIRKKGRYNCSRPRRKFRNSQRTPNFSIYNQMVRSW